MADTVLVPSLGLVNGSLGLVGIFKSVFPEPAPDQGTIVSIKAGRGERNVPEIAGDIAAAYAFDIDNHYLGKADGTSIESGDVQKIVVEQDSPSTRAEYVGIAIDSDAVYIAWVAVKQQDSTGGGGWTGDIGSACGQEWCTWLDADRNEDIPSAAMKFSVRAYGEDASNVADNEAACGYTLWGPDNGPINGAPGKRAVRAPTPAIEERLIVSNIPSHRAENLCNSDNSWGPDFVGTDGYFCDMGSKTLTPLSPTDIIEGCVTIDGETKRVEKRTFTMTYKQRRGRSRSSVASSLYRSVSQEIIASDIESILDDGPYRDDDDENIAGAHPEPPTPGESEPDPDLSMSALFMRPAGITFSATTRPAMAPRDPERTGRTRFATNRERQVSRNAERSLLRDNHLLPPKHRRDGQVSILRRVYRYFFSTKVREGSRPPSLHRVFLPPTEPSETSPLLPPSLSSTVGDGPLSDFEVSRWQAAVAANVIQTTWQRESLTLATYARSLAATFLMHYSVTIASIITVGRIGPVELGAVSLATVTANITCYTPVQGLATSLDTLCAQAFGSGHKRLVGLQCQRMLFLLWILLIPLIALWYNADKVLTALIPERETALLAAQYLRVLAIGAPGVAAFETAKRFVQAQGLFYVTTYVLLVGTPLNIFANWFFVFHLGWGFLGAPVAVVCIQTLLPILLVAYVYFIDGSECWDCFSNRAFTNWGPMVRLALPGMVMIEAQYFAFEVLTLVAGQFGGAALAAQSVLVTLGSTAYQVPFAVSIAASTRVANLIGARLSRAAWTSAKVSLVAGTLIGIANMVTLLALQKVLPHIFTDDEEVAAQVARVIPVLALLQVFDAMAAVSHGCLRGIGRQYVGGYTNLLSFYVVALPVSFATSFCLDWKLPGLWVGVTIGLVITTIVEIAYLYNADWDCAVAEAESRIRPDDGAGMK
ncbi:hypothetical protein HJFPF1_10549 [Paramyrothecium foliicola]|nr:hypothetical protein HJFPF1_10549 [Paramyrothecium foliicola]